VRVIQPVVRALAEIPPLFLQSLRLLAVAGAMVTAGWMAGLLLVSAYK